MELEAALWILIVGVSVTGARFVGWVPGGARSRSDAGVRMQLAQDERGWREMKQSSSCPQSTTAQKTASTWHADQGPTGELRGIGYSRRTLIPSPGERMLQPLELVTDLAKCLEEAEEASRVVPPPTPLGDFRQLTVGMVSYDDFDGVYFTLQAVRLYHPEVADRVAFVVVDNHPEGRHAAALRALENRIPRYRYVPFRGYRGTAVRDVIFREANSEIVLCVDSHVMFAPGALSALLDCFAARPDSGDLIQGPRLHDALDNRMATHQTPVWRDGMFGVWASDARGLDASGAPFEIEMQGLDVFACRQKKWPGLNQRFRGTGSEEGYLHEKIRRAGGRVLCLPALRWVHRFDRPSGPPYPTRWNDRVRNHLLGWRELGWNE